MKTTVILLAILGAYVAYYCLTKPLDVRLALPVSSIITMNEYHEDFPNGDYLHCIRAKVTEAEFVKFAEDMDLRKGEGLVERIPFCDAEWWDTDLFSEAVFGNRDNTNEFSSFTVYSNGSVYYLSHSS